MNVKARSFIHWAPRILCILAILFISMFALDAFDPSLTVGQQVLDFLMHLIPSFVLILILVLSWKWELVGGIVFTILGLVFSPLIFMHNYRMNGSVQMSLVTVALITLPFIIVGVLFIMDYRLRKMESGNQI